MSFAPHSPTHLLKSYDYELLLDRIAQHPAIPRESARLMVVKRGHGVESYVENSHFQDLPSRLNPDDLLVFNDTKVIPARIFGVKTNDPRREIQLLLVERVASNRWWCLAKPAKRWRPRETIRLFTRAGDKSEIAAVLIEKNADGQCLVEFNGTANILAELATMGHMPLPPYIDREGGRDELGDGADYQSEFAKHPGSIAAPTASLHFSGPLLQRLKERGIDSTFVTLHVGLGTFAPIRSEDISRHQMHTERFHLGAEAAAAIARTRAAGGRVIAVGTTTVRVLETAAMRGGLPLQSMAGETNIFIRPPYRFQAVDGMITNFHLPRSTLMMLVSAWLDPGGEMGVAQLLKLYQRACAAGYRFYSYGDGMLIL